MAICDELERRLISEHSVSTQTVVSTPSVNTPQLVSTQTESCPVCAARRQANALAMRKRRATK
jgi:hypothetical protein